MGMSTNAHIPHPYGGHRPSGGDDSDNAGTLKAATSSAGRPSYSHRATAGHAQFPALRYQGAALRGAGNGGRMGGAVTGRPTPARQGKGAWREGLDAYRETATAARVNELADAVEVQLDQLQQLVDEQALREARPLADKLRHLVLRPPLAFALRRRGAALIKLVYRHDNDTDALLAFTQDELAALERVLSDAVAGRPLAFP